MKRIKSNVIVVYDNTSSCANGKRYRTACTSASKTSASNNLLNVTLGVNLSGAIVEVHCVVGRIVVNLTSNRRRWSARQVVYPGILEFQFAKVNRR